MSSSKADERVIGRWTIGETLSKKEGYSWTKCGHDIKTGKIVSLTFIQKSDIIFTTQQSKMIETELEALNNIQHKNVKSLYSYHLNAAYPLRKFHSNDTQKFLDVILLIQEYNPGQRELFDLLYYYHSAFRESVARTFFRQLISGLEACHDSSVIHADLKIESLLLDTTANTCNLKIGNMGFSKIIRSNSVEKSMEKTQNMGAICCKAPELLSNKKYDSKCDVFSAGVILFVMVAGHPPFHTALKSDPWFKSLIKGNTEKFWKFHQRSPIASMPELKDLLTKMLTFDAEERIDMNGIKNHKWFKGNILNANELFNSLRTTYYRAEKKRQSDIRHKVTDFAEVSNVHKSKFKCIETRLAHLKLNLLPETDIEGMYCDIYTYIDNNCKHWCEIYNLMEQAVTSRQYQGYAYFDWDKQALICVLSVAKQCKKINATITAEQMVKFCVKVYESRMWKDKYLETDEDLEIKEQNEHRIYIIKVNRIEGDSVIFRDIRNSFLSLYCSTILKGLPKWARKIQTDIRKQQNDINEKRNELIDDYHKVIDDNDWKIQSALSKDTNAIDVPYPIYPLTEYKTYVFWETMETQLENDGMNYENISLLMGFLQRNSYDFKSVVRDMNFKRASKSRLVGFFNDTFNRNALEFFNILYKAVVYLANQKKYSTVVYNNSNKFWISAYRIDLLTNGWIRKYIKIKVVANDITIVCSNFYGYMIS